MIEASGSRRLGWGLVGCGWVATDYVAPAIAASGNGQLIAVCDPNIDARERLTDRCTRDGSQPTPYADLADLLADRAVEAVYVATPNHLHRRIVEACARAGRAILCEKPMATTLADAEAMVAAAEAVGVVYATAYDQRFHPGHRSLKQWVAEGALGTVTQARIHYACWLPGDWSGDNWRVDPKRAGGGAMIDLAPHGIDLLEVILGDEWAELIARTQRRVHDYPVDDGAILLGRMRSGTLATIQVAYNCPDAFPRRTLELVGTQAMVIAHDTMGQTPGGRIERIDAATGQRNEINLPNDPDQSPFRAQVEAFAGSILAGTPFPYSGRRDLKNFALLEAACR